MHLATEKLTFLFLPFETANDGSKATFTFPKKFKVASGESTLVWTAASPGQHNPPSDLLWKTQVGLEATVVRSSCIYNASSSDEEPSLEL